MPSKAEAWQTHAQNLFFRDEYIGSVSVTVQSMFPKQVYLTFAPTPPLRAIHARALKKLFQDVFTGWEVLAYAEGRVSGRFLKFLGFYLDEVGAEYDIYKRAP